METSPLTTLLQSTRGAREKHLQQRDYAAAKSLREDCFAQAAQIKESRLAELASAQQAERGRLRQARATALAAVHESTREEVAKIEEELEHNRQAFESRQNHREQSADRAVRARERNRPIPLSTYVRDLQVSEQRLAGIHAYEEAEQVRKKIAALEVRQAVAAMEASDARVERAAASRQRTLDSDSRNFRAKGKNRLQLAQLRAQREEERIAKKFDHAERDMHHAHTLERARVSSTMLTRTNNNNNNNGASPGGSPGSKPATAAGATATSVLLATREFDNTLMLGSTATPTHSPAAAATAVESQRVRRKGSVRSGASTTTGSVVMPLLATPTPTTPPAERRAASVGAANRGTRYLEGVKKASIRMASLCDMYANGVPESLQRSGSTLRLGSDPASPQRLDAHGWIDLSLPKVSAAHS